MDYIKIKKKFDHLCRLISLMATFGELFVLGYIWFFAYIDPQKVVNVYVNNYNEAFPELIMWFIMLPICTYGFYLNYKIIRDSFGQ